MTVRFVGLFVRFGGCALHLFVFDKAPVIFNLGVGYSGGGVIGKAQRYIVAVEIGYLALVFTVSNLVAFAETPLYNVGKQLLRCPLLNKLIVVVRFYIGQCAAINITLVAISIDDMVCAVVVLVRYRHWVSVQKGESQFAVRAYAWSI